MADNLVIVESPAKAKTIKKYLGRDFDVLASYGHVRDLVPKEGAVDPDNGYAMKYQVLEKNVRHVEAIARSLGKAKALYLATDPDREGEAIAWHLKEILAARGDPDDAPRRRRCARLADSSGTRAGCSVQTGLPCAGGDRAAVSCRPHPTLARPLRSDVAR